MNQSRLESDLFVAGSLSCRTFMPPAASIANDAIAPNAKIDATKLRHRRRVVYAQSNATAAADTRVMYHVYGATGTIIDVRAGSIAVCTGNATITVELRRNGTSVLAAPIVLDSGNQPLIAEPGTISSSALAAHDVLDVVVTTNAGSGTLGTGVFVALLIDEDAQ